MPRIVAGSGFRRGRPLWGAGIRQQMKSSHHQHSICLAGFPILHYVREEAFVVIQTIVVLEWLRITMGVHPYVIKKKTA
jgi:hypothetical protein